MANNLFTKSDGFKYDYDVYRNIFYEDKFCFKNNVELINFVK